MEIPALLRRSARYVLVQRGYVVLLFAAAAVTIAVFTRVFSRFFAADSNVGMMLSAGFGIAMVWVSAPLVNGERSDRSAFFRSAFDARVILDDLVKKTRTVSERHELAALLEKQIRARCTRNRWRAIWTQEMETLWRKAEKRRVPRRCRGQNFRSGLERVSCCKKRIRFRQRCRF